MTKILLMLAYAFACAIEGIAAWAKTTIADRLKAPPPESPKDGAS